jgi:hypothetical protein
METTNDSGYPLNMNKHDYHSTIVAKITPKEALDKISRVSEWWAKDFDGRSQKLNDVFTVRFGNGDMYKVKVSEIIPDKKIIWDVIDSYQGWHKNHAEWVGTQIVWEVFPQKDNIEVMMTHVGLVPEFECFDKCSQGWDYLLQKSIFRFLSENIGLPV